MPINLKISAIKTTLLGDVKSLAIIDLHLTTTRRHDTQLTPRLAIRNLDAFTILIGDKGYDDHRFSLPVASGEEKVTYKA